MQLQYSSVPKTIFAVITGAILLVLGFMFSLVILSLAVVAGLAAWGWFWWKTRELRKVMQQRPADGHIIEGEAMVVDEYRAARVVDRIEASDKPE